MVTKKMSQAWSLIIVLCVYGLSVASDVIYPENENVQLSREVVLEENEEKEIIVVGNASTGNASVTGKACVVTSKKQLKKVHKGDIVVAPAIHSSWYPVLGQAAGIITEKGDGSSHALLLGKKLGIPVVVGASGATKNIIDGQTITLDPITRNIYHVAYPDPKEVHFDVLTMPQKDDDYQSLHDKLENLGKPRPLKPATGAHDHFLYSAEDKNKVTTNNIQEYKTKRITKDVYSSHFERFKKFVLGEKSQFEWTKKWFGMKAVEAGARSIGKCDKLAVECISVGEEFFDSAEKYFVEVLRNNGQSAYYIQYIDSLLEECSKKPGNLNYVAWASHRGLVEATAPEAKDIKKEDLIEHPKKYKEIEHRVDKTEQHAHIAAGLFVRYWIHERLPL